jgi:competence protein ComEC
MGSVLFYTLGIAFTSGVFLRSFFDVGGEGTGLLFCISIACIVAWRIKSRGFNSPLFLIGIGVFCFAFGTFRMYVADSYLSPLTPYENKSVSIEGRIAREPEVRDTSIHVYIEPKGDYERGDEHILVFVDRFIQPSADLSYGDIVRVEGKLSRPEPFDADGGRVFDYPGFLKSKGVEFVVYRGEVTVLTQERDTFMGDLFRGKQKFMETFEHAVPEPYAGLGEGLLLGVKRALGNDLEATFRETGIIHIVVLSGYNIMIVVEFLMFLLSFLFFPRARMIFGMIIIVLFALLVGLSATVVRAAIMAGLIIVARGTRRTYAVLRALMLAGVLMLIHNPYLLVHDPGFQLSFLATLGLILVAPHIESRLMMIPDFWGTRGFLTATLATQVFVLPLLLYHMGLVPVLSVFVNVLVLPMVPIAMLLTFITGIVGLLSSTLGLFSGFFTYLSLAYIIKVAEIFGSFPFASFSIDAFPFWIVVCTYVIYTYILLYLDKNERKTLHTTVIPQISKERIQEIKNDYEGWIIEEAKESPRRSKNDVGDVSDLPFR